MDDGVRGQPLTDRQKIERLIFVLNHYGVTGNIWRLNTANKNYYDADGLAIARGEEYVVEQVGRMYRTRYAWKTALRRYEILASDPEIVADIECEYQEEKRQQADKDRGHAKKMADMLKL